MAEFIQNHAAYDKAARRKARHTAKRLGVDCPDLGRLQKRSEADVKLRCNLADLAKAGDRGAAKRKRALNNTWTDRGQKGLGDYWNPTAERRAFA